MYKKSPNPKIEELTKSHSDRSIDLSRIRTVKLEDGSRLCVWCQEKKLGNHPNQKYCSTSCSDQAWAWAYPQKEHGLSFLLIRQDYCCNLCKYDYKPFIEEQIIGKFYGTKNTDDVQYRSKFNYWIMKQFKRRIDKKLKPEVDHIEPIYKGGQSLGLENHQAICYTCHKGKSRVDNSGPRKNKKC